VVLGSLSLCLLAPISLYYLACIQGMERPRRWATGSVLSALLVFGLAVVGALGFGRWGHGGLLALIAAGWAVAAAVCVMLARGALGFLWSRTDWQYVRELIRFLLPVWLIPLLSFGSRTILKSYLAVKQGPVPVGQLEIALTLLLHLGTVYHACMIVFVPAWARLYARRDGAALLRSISQVRGALLGVAVVYGGVLALGGQWVVPAIFGADQAGAVPAARIIGLVMPVMIGGWVASVTNILSNRTRIMGQANIIWFCIAVPVALAAIPSLGAAGGSVSFLAAYMVFTWFYISRARPFFGEIAAWEREQRDVCSARP
jgi:O-antigen/teichoic acid export membrane protein